MKTLTIVFSLAAAGLFLSSCASTGTDPGYEDPDNLETSSRLQEAHSQVLRQNF